MISIFNRYSKDKSGLAATEFALVAPIMIFLFFAVVEGSDTLTASRKVSLAANTLSDLVAQELSIEKDQLADLFVGMENIIDDRNISVDFTVVSVIKDPGTDQPVVHWSRDSNNNEPFSAGSPYTKLPDPSLLDDTESLIVGEVSYNYVPTFTSFLIGAKTIENTATRWPRRSLRVQFCTSPGNCTS